MEIRNRMADVVKLRCNACQDFFKMLLNDNWQQSLYELARREVNNPSQKNRYIATYEKMRDISPEKYTVNDMDLTIISAIVDASANNKYNSMKKVNEYTRKALIAIREDRNLNDHSDENEEPDELYLRGLLALCNLKNFIRTVDKHETSIEDIERLSYRKKYNAEIDSLKDIFDEERIELIQWKKQIDKDIHMAMESNNPSYAWEETRKNYMDRAWRVDHEYDKYDEFIVKSSDNGIEAAHSWAVGHFIIDKDYVEAERRLFMWYNSKKEFHKNEVYDIVERINDLLKQQYEMTNTLQEIIEGLIKKGFKISKTEKGQFKIDEK